MASKAKLRRKIKRLKARTLDLIVECNAARARAGEANEALAAIQWPYPAERVAGDDWEWQAIQVMKKRLDG